MKKILYILIFISFSKVKSQVNEKIKFELGMGYIIYPTNGIIFSLEPKYKIKENIEIGILFKSSIQARTGDNFDPYILHSKQLNNSLSVTYDYFNKNKNLIKPFIGGGIGLYSIKNTYTFKALPFLGLLDPQQANKVEFGGLIRTGIEYKRFKLSLEYVLLPKSDISDSYRLATIQNSNIGIHLNYSSLK